MSSSSDRAAAAVRPARGSALLAPDRLALAAQLGAAVVVSVGLLGPYGPALGPAVGSLLLLAITAIFAVAAALAGRREQGVRRVLFLGFAASALCSTVAQLHNTVRYVIPGEAPVFPSPGLFALLLGSHPLLLLALGGALGWRRRATRADQAVDALLLAAAAAVLGVQLAYLAPWPLQAFDGLAHALLLLWRVLPVAELCLAIALVATRGDLLGRRTALGLVWGMLAFSAANLLHGRLALIDSAAAVTANDVVWALSTLGFAEMLRGEPGPLAALGGRHSMTASAQGLRGRFVLVAILIAAQATLYLGLRGERSIALAGAVALFLLLLALRGVRELRLQRHAAAQLASSVASERALTQTLEQQVDERTVELVQAERRFRTLFRSAPDAVLTLRGGARIHEANDCARELFAVGEGGLAGRALDELVLDADRDALATALAAGLRGQPARVDVRVPRHDGPRHVEIALRRLPDGDDDTLLLIGRDITQEQAMQARLVETERLAAVGELVAGVAHEVNNPLSSISAFAQLMLLDARLAHEPELREGVEVIHGEALRASQVVRDLLAFARRSAPQRGPVELAQVVERALRLRAYQLASGGVQLVRDIPDTLPLVHGDARQLQQVVLNLVTNALQAMPRGGELRLEARLRDGRVELDIVDSGEGIPPAATAHVFEPFFTTKPEGEGTGLGLSVSYGIVAAHGGSLSLVESSARGTRLRVSLPVAPEGVEATVAERAVAEGAPEPAHEHRSPLAGLRLLFVDDEATLRLGMEAFGRRRGIAVVSAACGRSALEAVERTSFDAVVCDLRMPGLDGVAFHDALRARRPDLAARTVFVTGDMLGGTARFTSSTRPVTIAKPFSFDQLEEAVAALLRAAPLPATSA